jgi:hypothetical protein
VANVSAFTGAMPVIPGGTVELGYQSTDRTNVAVSQTTQANATELVSTTVICDGSPILIEFECCIACATGEGVQIGVWVDGVYNSNFEANTNNQVLRLAYAQSRRITPAAGSRTISVRWWRWTGSTLQTSLTGNAVLRVSKIVNQNDGLKPFWTPPVVTQLPSQATEGDQVLLYSSSPYAGYQTHQYASGSWRTLGDSRAMGAWQTYTPTLAQSGTVSPVTVNQARYTQIGKTVMGNVYLTVASGGTGSAGSNVTCTLPLTATGITGPPIGPAYIYDASTNVSYVCQATLTTTSSVAFVNDQGGGGSWGSGPSVGLAVSDQIRFSFVYEVA